MSESSVPSPVNAVDPAEPRRDLLGAQPFGRRTHRVPDPCTDDDREEAPGELGGRRHGHEIHVRLLSRLTRSPGPARERMSAITDVLSWSARPAPIASSHLAIADLGIVSLSPAASPSSSASARSLRASARRKSTLLHSAEHLVAEPIDERAERPEAERVEHDLRIEAVPIGEREDLAQAHHRRHVRRVGGELHRGTGAEATHVAHGPQRSEDLRASVQDARARRPPGSRACPPRVGDAPEDRSIQDRDRSSFSAAARIAVGPTVDMSMRVASGAIVSAAPSGPKRTCSKAGGSATIVITTAAPCAASAGVAARTRPAATSASSRPGVRFQRRSSCPASRSLPAIGSTHRTETEERHAAHAGTRATTTSISAPPATCGNDIIRSIVRISGVSTRVVDAGDRDWVFVRVDTDEPGLVGWGESSLGWHTRAVCGAVEDLAPLIVGRGPARGRAPLADDDPRPVLPGRHRRDERGRRDRPGALGHQGEGARGSAVRAPRRARSATGCGRT